MAENNFFNFDNIDTAEPLQYTENYMDEPTPEDFNSNDTVTLPGPTKESNLSERHKKDAVEPFVYRQSDMDEHIKNARSDFDVESKACEIYWEKKYAELQNNMREEIEMRELIEKDNREQIHSLRLETSNMKLVLAQYEKTIVELAEDTHLDQRLNDETAAESIRAKEVLQEDLNTAEHCLFDAYKRIQTLKETVDTLKRNEDILKNNSIDLTAKIERSEERYENLKAHALEKIDEANMVITSVRKQQTIDIAGLQASLKLAQSRMNNMESEIHQKNVENQQLTQICDDLIRKVSGN